MQICCYNNINFIVKLEILQYKKKQKFTKKEARFLSDFFIEFRNIYRIAPFGTTVTPPAETMKPLAISSSLLKPILV